GGGRVSQAEDPLPRILSPCAALAAAARGFARLASARRPVLRARPRRDVAYDLFDEITRPAFGFEIYLPQTFTDDAERQQLDTAEEIHRQHHRCPSRN